MSCPTPTSSEEGSNTCATCITNYYRDPTYNNDPIEWPAKACRACPEDGICDGHTLPIPAEGYWCVHAGTCAHAHSLRCMTSFSSHQGPTAARRSTRCISGRAFATRVTQKSAPHAGLCPSRHPVASTSRANLAQLDLSAAVARLVMRSTH